jgi:hypothetical protein
MYEHISTTLLWIIYENTKSHEVNQELERRYNEQRKIWEKHPLFKEN